MEAKDFTPLRLKETLPLLERDEMSDEDMVAHLARCQIDPAAPRSSIETLLHAFIPAAHVHHTHPDGINVLAGTQRRRATDRRVLRRGGGVDSVHPARLHARQAGRPGRSQQPGPEARRAGQARPRRLGRLGRRGVQAHDRGDQPGGRVRERQDGGKGALRRRAGGAGHRPVGPADRAPASAARRGVERAPKGSGHRHVAARARVRFLQGGARAHRHRRGVPGSPRPHQARAALGPVRSRLRGREHATGARARTIGALPG